MWMKPMAKTWQQHLYDTDVRYQTYCMILLPGLSTESTDIWMGGIADLEMIDSTGIQVEKHD